MAAASTIFSRLSSRSQSLVLKFHKTSFSSGFSPLKSSYLSQLSNSSRRIHGISRLPLELSSVGSLTPLHNAIASARLVSILSAESQSWGLIPQGISMPL